MMDTSAHSHSAFFLFPLFIVKSSGEHVWHRGRPVPGPLQGPSQTWLLQRPSEGVTGIPILQKRKLRLIEVRWLVQDHTASEPAFEPRSIGSQLSSGGGESGWVHDGHPGENRACSENQIPSELLRSQSWGACQHLQEEARSIWQLLWQLVFL